jgi:hypothetical protein
MKQRAGPARAEQVMKDIRRATRKHHSAEDKIRIVLEGLRGEGRPRSLKARGPCSRPCGQARARSCKCLPAPDQSAHAASIAKPDAGLLLSDGAKMQTGLAVCNNLDHAHFTQNPVDARIASLTAVGLTPVSINLLALHGTFWAIWLFLAFAVAAGVRWVTRG